MTLVTELDLPELDPADPELRGDRWHVAANGLLDSGKWVAQGPLSLIIVEREAGEFFLRSKSTEFPGKLIGDLFGVTDGPLREEIDANIINTNGDVHRRLRSLVNPALTPRAANGWRPVMREILEGLWDELETDEFDFVSRFIFDKQGFYEAYEEMPEKYQEEVVKTLQDTYLTDKVGFRRRLYGITED